ncbi:MAG: RND family transporter [Myxococcota bacterium]
MPENGNGQQSYMEDALPERAVSMRFGRLIMKNRFATLMTLLSISVFFATPLVNALLFNLKGTTLPGITTRFHLDTRVRDTFPEHDFIHAQDKFTGRFGTASYVSLAVVKKDGDIYDPDFLEKVERITRVVDETPFVNHYQVNSIAHINTRVIIIEPDGSISAEPLMDEVPEEDEDLEAFKRTVHENPGLIHGFLVSRDDKAVQVVAGFITHRLDNAQAYQDLFSHLMKLKADEEADGTVEIHITGQPILVGWVYVHAFEIQFYLLLTIVMLFILLLAYFRRLHGVAIPMVAGLSTAIWGMGFCAWVGISLDPLVLVIPLLITARSISHTVQMAERFFEDFEMEVDARQRQAGRTLTHVEITDAKVETATTAMAKLMLPGMLGIITDAAGLMVIFLTTIQQMRNLAIFGSFWVLAIIFNVILLHPIMIAYLPPPHESKHFTPKLMTRFLAWAGRLTTGAVSKRVLVGTAAVFLVFATYYVLYNSTIGESRPGFPIFWPQHPFNVATGEVAKRFGGVDQFLVFVDGDQNNASADGSVLQRMEAMQRYMRHHTNPGALISLVSIVRQFWAINHYGDPKWGFVPDSASTIASVVFQLQRAGAPGALRPFLTDEAEDANIKFFYPDHRGETIRRAVHFAREFIEQNPMGRLSVKLRKDRGGPLDAAYYMLGPVLFPRRERMEVQVAEISEEQSILGYHRGESVPVGEWTEPLDAAEVEKNVIATIRLNAGKKLPEFDGSAHLYEDLGIRKERIEKIAKKLSSQFDYHIETVRQKASEVAQTWQTVGQIVDYVVARSRYFVIEEWRNEERGIRAQNIRYCKTYCDYELWVKNEKFRDASWNPQPTRSWTRGAELSLAGGVMGILAATNEEVERGHVANILLIFLVVFTFVSVSYRSAVAGGAIVFSLAAGTMLSLFYMAITNTGLNVNTLPVQSVGVGIGVDYAIYITDRIRQEFSWCGDLDEGIRRAIRTTGMAVSFTATTLVGGIIWWRLSELRFQGEMAWLLSILMVVNMIGAIFLVPSIFSILRPKFFAASLTSVDQQQPIEAEKRAATGTA